jgi:starch phosphorylase
MQRGDIMKTETIVITGASDKAGGIHMNQERVVAYFSMEIALRPDIPTYSGGLGVLAGDTVRSAADLGIPMVAVSLLYRKGHFFQKLDKDGRQSEESVQWAPEDYLEALPERIILMIENRPVFVRPWLYHIQGVTGWTVPVYLLDTDLPENSDEDRKWTDSLYGGDLRYRFCQEVILGIGGVKIIEALGHNGIRRFHMNEGHSALLVRELLMQEAKKAGRTYITGVDIEAVREKCIFTTHTPVPAGHDQFQKELVLGVLGDLLQYFDPKDGTIVNLLDRVLGLPEELTTMEELRQATGTLNMTLVALNLSHYVNGVAKKHTEITKLMFAEYIIHSITNGVHGTTWTSKPFQELYDRYIPGWRQDTFSLRYALSIPKQEVWDAHEDAKTNLIEYVNRETNAGMSAEVFTIGFARRAATYKRADLLFSDPARLQEIAAGTGKIQIIYAGKAHPQDQGGKDIIAHIWEMKKALAGVMKIAYLPNYDMTIGSMVTSGVDLWLNTPLPPMEASGTSGMKAALNGVPSLSVLDGWWIEGWIEGVTGWAIGKDSRNMEGEYDSSHDAASLYDKLQTTIVPLFYDNRPGFIDVMLHCVALNGSFFNTHRMVQQYVANAYFL